MKEISPEGKKVVILAEWKFQTKAGMILWTARRTIETLKKEEEDRDDEAIKEKLERIRRGMKQLQVEEREKSKMERFIEANNEKTAELVEQVVLIGEPGNRQGMEPVEVSRWRQRR